MNYVRTINHVGPAKPRVRGLGDAVAVVAEPIAAVSDRVFRTHLKGCGGCARRRALLNRLVPFGPPAPASVSTVDEKPT